MAARTPKSIFNILYAPYQLACHALVWACFACLILHLLRNVVGDAFLDDFTGMMNF